MSWFCFFFILPILVLGPDGVALDEGGGRFAAAGERGVSGRMSTIDMRLRKKSVFLVNNADDFISMGFCAIYCAMTKKNVCKKFYGKFSKDQYFFRNYNRTDVWIVQ